MEEMERKDQGKGRFQKKITRRTTEAKGNKFLQAMASFRQKLPEMK